MRYQQPQAAAVIDWSNPITRGLAFYQVGASDGVFTNVSNATMAVNSGGAAKKYGGGSYLSAPNSAIGSSALTLFALVRLTTGANNAVISIGGAANDRHLLYVLGAGGIAMFSGQASGATGQASGGTVPSGILTAVAGRVSGIASRDAWINGVKVGTNASSVTVGTCNTIALGAYWHSGAADGSYFLAGEEDIALAWNRALSDAELKSLSDNPWQLFRSLPRAMLATAAPSGSTGTLAVTEGEDSLAAAGAVSITGTLASTEGADTAAASGTAGSAGVSGTLASTEGSDTLAASGTAALAAITGTLARTEGADTLAAAGTSAAPMAPAGDGGGAGNVREVRRFADLLDKAHKPTRSQKKKRRLELEAEALELLPDLPEAAELAPVAARIVFEQEAAARATAYANRPIEAMAPVVIPFDAHAALRDLIAKLMADEAMRHELEAEEQFETELLLLGS